MKKKVLLTAYNLDIGGIERSLLSLLKNIDYRKYEVVLVLEKYEGIFLGEVPKEVKIEVVRVFKNKFPLIHKARNLIEKLKFFKNYKQNYFDLGIVYAPYSLNGNMLVRKTSRVKKIYVHTNYVDFYGGDKSKARAFFESLYLYDFDKIIFVSNEAEKSFNKLFPSYNDKTLTVNNLVDQKRILSLSKEKKISKPKAKQLLVFVGRLDEREKKITRQLELVNDLNKQKIPVELWLIGDGKDKDFYKREVKSLKLNNVKFLGKKTNPYIYMKEADYLLLSSDYEGFPVVYNEALVLKRQMISMINVSDDEYKASDVFFITRDAEEALEIIKEKRKKETKKLNFTKINKRRVEKILEIE